VPVEPKCIEGMKEVADAAYNKDAVAILSVKKE